MGSGVIFEVNASDGSALVLTNYHVIEGASSIRVTVTDSVMYTGALLGVDAQRDLAVLKICCSSSFQALPFGDTASVEVGSDVIAIGYALGIEGPATVTRGIVSAIRYDNDFDRWVIQTDAPINPGNSGGPLLSLSGEILGINTFRIEQTASGRPVEAFGFAVSVATVQAVLLGLKSGAFATAPTPTPQPSAPEGIYTSEKYWYTIEVPSGWRIDASDDTAVVVWDPRSGATVWVSVIEINPSTYPTLDSYVAAWQPAPSEGWTDFQIVSRRRIRTGMPVEAHENVTKFTSGGSSAQEVSHWYVLGRYQVSVSAVAHEAIWNLQEYSEIRTTLERVQESFRPSIYTSVAYGYSLAHPPSWELVEDPDRDYGAYDPISGTTVVRVQILSASGYSSINTYGQNHTVIDADILSRQLMFTGRPNPSHRIDYTATRQTTGKLFRGAVLITLSGQNAIWVFVSDYAENWTNIQSLVDDIFLRVAVKP